MDNNSIETKQFLLTVISQDVAGERRAKMCCKDPKVPNTRGQCASPHPTMLHKQ